MGKRWYLSKTVWINVLSVAAIIFQAELGYVISPEMQVYVLGIINVILRTITKEKIIWDKFTDSEKQ